MEGLENTGDKITCRGWGAEEGRDWRTQGTKKQA
jgi:hypothetical protein